MSDEQEIQVEPTLRETLEAAVAEHREAPADDVTESKPVAAEVEKPATEGRDETGRFKAKEADKTAVAAPVTPPAAIKAPPNKWPVDRKEKFAKLAPDVQDMILEREKEVEEGFTRIDDERKFGKELKEIVTPYLATIQAEGGTPQGAFRDLLNTSHILRTGSPDMKARAVTQAIQQFGVDVRLISQMLQGHQQQPQQYSAPQPQVTPEVIQNTVQQELQKQLEAAKIQQEYTAFSSNPKNAHFASQPVQAKMASLLKDGQAKDYQDAYDQACWAVPEIRQMMLTAQAAETDSKRKEEMAAKRKAGSSVSGSPGITVPNSGTPNRSLREEIAANLAAQRQ